MFRRVSGVQQEYELGHTIILSIMFETLYTILFVISILVNIYQKLANISLREELEHTKRSVSWYKDQIDQTNQRVVKLLESTLKYLKKK